MNVVYAYAKILILKQITTGAAHLPEILRCICLCKDTNFKANHNLHMLGYGIDDVVYAYAKILILKQITTKQEKDLILSKLYMPMQRY